MAPGSPRSGSDRTTRRVRSSTRFHESSGASMGGMCGAAARTHPAAAAANRDWSRASPASAFSSSMSCGGRAARTPATGSSLLVRRRPAAEHFEGEPAKAVVRGAGMREQILRDARRATDAEGVEPGVLEGRVDIRCGLLGRLMLLVDLGVVEALPEGEAIAERAQAADRGGIGRAPAGPRDVRSTRSGERARARADCLDSARGEGTRHAGALVAARAGPGDGKFLADAALVVLGDERPARPRRSG